MSFAYYQLPQFSRSIPSTQRVLLEHKTCFITPFCEIITNPYIPVLITTKIAIDNNSSTEYVQTWTKDSEDFME